MDYDELFENRYTVDKVVILDAITDLESLLVLRYESYCRGFWGGFGELSFDSWKGVYGWGTSETITKLKGLVHE